MSLHCVWQGGVWLVNCLLITHLATPSLPPSSLVEGLLPPFLKFCGWLGGAICSIKLSSVDPNRQLQFTCPPSRWVICHSTPDVTTLIIEGCPRLSDPIRSDPHSWPQNVINYFYFRFSETFCFAIIRRGRVGDCGFLGLGDPLLELVRTSGGPSNREESLGFETHSIFNSNWRFFHWIFWVLPSCLPFFGLKSYFFLKKAWFFLKNSAFLANIWFQG